MKPISPLSLYIFLSLTSAAPIIPGRELCTLHGLCGTSPKPFIAILSVFRLKYTTPQTEPHSPKYQLSIAEILTRPSTPEYPPVTITPSQVKDAEVPLESSYLLNLSKNEEVELDLQSTRTSTGTSFSTTKDLPSAPSSALPELRAEEARKLELSLLRSSKPKKASTCSEHAILFEETQGQQKELKSLRKKLQKALLGSVSLTANPQEINSYFTELENILPESSFSAIHRSKINTLLKKIANKNHFPYDDEYRFSERARNLLSAYDRKVGAQSRRDAVHGDVLVVGIVVLFVCAVIIVELADLAVSSVKSFFGIRSKGAIRLPSDDEIISGLRPFQLMPAPKGRKYSLEKIVEEE